MLSVMTGLALSILVFGTLTSVSEAASSPLFVCGESLCNLDEEDQYCENGGRPDLERCAYCRDEKLLCFTEHMAFNCTTYCRGLDKERVLKDEREKGCPMLGNLTDGSHNSSASPLPGEIVLITCNSGCRVEGNPVLTCLKFGMWSGDLPTCTDNVCNKPTVDHVEIADDGQMTAVGSIISYSCDDGYTPSNPEAHAMCMPDGSWQSLSCHKMENIAKTSSQERVWTIVAIAAMCSSVVLLLVLVVMCLRMKKKNYKYQKIKNSCAKTSDEKHNEPSNTSPSSTDDSDQTYVMQVVNEINSNTEIDQKQNSKPLPPRNAPTVPSAPGNSIPGDYPYLDDDSLPSSIASSTESTNPKDVQDSDPRPELGNQGSSNIHVDESPGSETGSITYKLGNLHINFNLNNHNNHHNNNHNNNNNNNNNSSNNSSNKPNNILTNPEGTDTEKKKADKVSDKTPFPTQASNEDAKGGNAEGAAGPATAEAGLHAQPVDETKPGKIALKDNTVLLSDVKRKSRHSAR